MPGLLSRHPGCQARQVLVLACILLLAACARVPDISPVSHETDPNRLNAGKEIQNALPTGWPKEEWWKAYGDAQLDALVTRAVADNPGLHAAQARVALAQALAERAQAETRPSLDIDITTMRERFTAEQFIPPPYGGHTFWNNRAALTLGYDLDLWGRQESVWRASVSEASARAAEQQQVKLELELAVIRSYIQLALRHDMLDIAEQRRGLIEHQLAIARKGQAAGLFTQAEVSEIETTLPLASAQIKALQAQIQLLRHQLGALTGEGPGAGESIRPPALHLQAPPGLPDTLPANLIGRRPDVIAHRWRVEAEQENIQSAKTLFYPNINLMAYIGVQALGFSQLLGNSAAIAGIGPALSLPIFDAGRRRSNLQARTASYDIAVESYNDVMLRALQDVSDQLVLLQANASQREDAERALASARKTEALAMKNYRAGLADYRHVLQTQAAVLQRQEYSAQLQFAGMDAYAALMRSLGGGVTEAGSAHTAGQP